MRATYFRAMTGGTVTGPPIKKRWVYLLVACLLAAAAVSAPDAAKDLLTHPVGIVAVVVIVAGFALRSSTSLVPWMLVSGALALYALARTNERLVPVANAAQIVCLATAGVVGSLQLKVDFSSGQAAQRPGRTRWGSVLVAGTMFVLAVGTHLSTVPVVGWARTSDERPDRFLARTTYGSPVRTGRLENPSITESSGLAASVRNEGRLWTHNDSGNAPVVYCIGPAGEDCGVFHVTGATVHDWEDIAVGPGPQPGNSYLYMGDIGGNIPSETSDTVTVYRLPEPPVDSAASGSTAADPVPTTRADAIRLHYPDGPHDAETLLVHPYSGDLYVITKEIDSGVYKASAPLKSGAPIELVRVARFSIFATLSDRTGGAISPDGRRVALSTYGGAFELVLPPDIPLSEFDKIWKQTPAPIRMGPLTQAEAITYRSDGLAIYATSEGRFSPIYEVERV